MSTHMSGQDADSLRAELGAAQVALQHAAARIALLEANAAPALDGLASMPQSEDVLRALANSFPQPAWMASADGASVWYNQRWYDYTGVTEQQMERSGWHNVVDPAVLPAVLQHWSAALASGEPFEMEFPVRGADGRYRWFLTRASAVRDAAGTVVRWFGTNTDVDQVKRAEQALRDESHVLELLERHRQRPRLDSATCARCCKPRPTPPPAYGQRAPRRLPVPRHATPGRARLFTLYTVSGAVSRPSAERLRRSGRERRCSVPSLPSQHARVLVRSNDVMRRRSALAPHQATRSRVPAGHPAGEAAT